MTLRIILADGTDYNERTNDVSDAHQQAVEAKPLAESNQRTVTEVAAELEAAILAAKKVKALTDELHGLLGRRRRKVGK